jgi:hypothetical protein
MEIIPNTELAYMAGYLDGDGCINFPNYENRYIGVRINITSGDKQVLDKFSSWFGNKVRKTGGGKNRQLYQWSADGDRAQSILACLLPFLVMKRELAGLALSFTFDPYKDTTEEEKKLRLACKERSHEINRRVTIGA